MSFLNTLDSSKWLKFLCSSLKTMQERDVMCDVTIWTSDGEAFRAHACVLAASSSLLKSSLVLKPSSSQYDVKLDGISGEVWQKLVHFIYSGILDTPLTYDFLCAAEQLNIRSLLAASKKLDDSVHISYSQDKCIVDNWTGSNCNRNGCTRYNCITSGCTEGGLCAANQKMPSFQTSDKECDELFDKGSDDGDRDTVDYSNDINTGYDMYESYDDDIKIESSCILCQSPQSDAAEVKLENTLPDDVQYGTGRSQVTTRESDSDIEHRTARKKCSTTTFRQQFFCDKCPKVYTYKSAYLKHEKRHQENTAAVDQTLTVAHNENSRYECRQCNKSYTSVYLLKRHSILHSDHNPYVCSICGKHFSQSSVIKQHMRVHTGERPYVCSFCGKTFSSVSCLNTHNQTHLPEKTHKCSSCSRSFSCRAYLQRHLVVHGAPKAYWCSTCGKSFRDSGVLKIHQRVHTGERPLKCDVCGKSFRESSALLMHRRRHTGEKPFKCRTCGNAFTTTSHLYTHERTHVK